ncbi:uncharacterized protein LOC119602250 [Lucilia sericata]|uniref:uncharacterized protein LOC119602250 n=1 Tax=Lucilia sericata TaxID=13632 RepID=UPI0018A85F1F|nr:uncharacterized protein LOC119602250 [Lucilia sericata]
MSCENCLHLIKLLNLQDNFVIPQQILLIKGVVEQPKCYKQQDIALYIENRQILSTGLCHNTGRFKFLIDLGQENRKFQLNFSYGKVKLLINIIYEKKESLYKIQPLIILAKDEVQQNEIVKLNQQIIDLNLLLIQTVYAEKLWEAVKQRLTFVFNDKCKIFISKLTKKEIWQLEEQDLWLQIAKDLLASEWGNQDHIKSIAFINCSKYLGSEIEKSKDFSYQNIRKHIKGHAALGAGGLALFSTTYFYSWPSEFADIFKCFLNQQNLNLAFEPDDSNYRKTKAGVYASSLGAVCHEIGHIFDLGHDLQGVMGSNFDYINRVFTLQTKTEHLPERIVQQKPITANKPRFTRLKDPANGFLQRYREQQENDSFYFSPNSAVILAHHAWLRKDLETFQSNAFKVKLDLTLGIVKSLELPLKIIELRENSNSLVKEWFELQKTSEEKPVFEFDLKVLRNNLPKDNYLFVMSIYGHTKKLEL